MNSRLLVMIVGVSVMGCGPISKWMKPQKSDERLLTSVSEYRDEAKPLQLQTFASCLETDAYLQQSFRRRTQLSLDRQRFDLERQALLEKRAGRSQQQGAANDSLGGEAAENMASSAGGSGPSDYTQTNTQVAGVDEPDIMKNSGTHIYMISGSTVQVTASWPANEMRKIAQISVIGMPRALMLTEQQKLLVVYHPYSSSTVSPQPVMGRAVPWVSSPYPDMQVTRLAFYDVSTPAAPRLEKELSFFGTYLSLRRQGELLRLIQSDTYFGEPSGLVSSISLNWSKSAEQRLEEFKTRRREIDAANELVLQKLSLQSYLAPFLERRVGMKFDDPILGDAPDCQNILVEEEMTNAGLSKVTSIHLGDGSLSQLSLLAPSNHIYSSEKSLYLANTYHGWWWGWGRSQGAKTYLHKLSYDPEGTARVQYQGSGMVDGYILNQFSMDEYKDHLRVAVTDSNVRMEDREVARFSTEVNRVYVLANKEGRLERVGQTPDLAPGERIYSARFVGDRGYVVTFRQVDPLFTLDLSVPTEPKVLGELKIPGFSNYMHPLSAQHLLAVGQDADPSTGRVRGLKLSLFDVSDPTQPKETHSLVFGQTQNSWSWSEAQYDHKAFTYFASRGLLGIPVGGYRSVRTGTNWWDMYFSELLVFHVDPVQGIRVKGSVAMNDLYRSAYTDWGYWWEGAQVRRSVFADDFIYAVSNQGIRAVHQQNLSLPVSSISFYP